MNTILRDSPIAIIGLGALMPQASNTRAFWNNIIGKVDCITDVPASRWNVDDYYDPDPTAEDKTYSKRGGFLPDVNFDPLEFGLPPNILEVTDASQLLSLLVAKEALGDAGYLQGTETLRDRTGVILGVCSGQKLINPLSARLQYPIWDQVLQSYGIGDNDRQKIIERMKLAYVGWEENSFPGLLGNVVSGRIANRFDLGGTNCTVDAACASTMAALKMAVGELVEGHADMMLTGGVDTDNSIFTYLCFSKTPAFSKGSHPRPFDAASDGMMVGEGIGMMVLKRLADAERDGDRIYAVIKGLGSSSDGRYKSIYAPRGEGQEKALERAYADAGFSPSTVGLVEAHGTGTVAGDTTEVTTIIRYFNQHDDDKQHVALGSVKSQIGHTKASAGAAGLIKTALALHHKVLPPTLHVDQPNPKFDMPNSSFYVNGEARPWIQPTGDLPRRAGVSSFGFGGTNFHVVLEEYTGEHQAAYRVHHTAQTVILNAGTPRDLATKINETLSQLQREDGERYFLNLVRDNMGANLPTTDARVGFVAADSVEATALLRVAAEMLTSKPDAQEWQHPKGVFYRSSSLQVAGHVVALFAGQGSQYLDMGRDLALNFPEVRDSFAQVDALMQNKGKPTLSSVVFPHSAFSDEEKNAQETALQNTVYAQPAIGALSAGMYRLLQNAGFHADFTAGHSFGEVSALWAAGVLSDSDYYTLIEARGAAMTPPNNADVDVGTMLAVSGDVDAIEREVAHLPGVQVANRNSRTQVVLAGTHEAVAQAEKALKAKGYKATPLPVSAAFHTPLVGHAQQPFAEAIRRVTFNPSNAPVYSNTTGKPYPNNPAAMQTQLAEHLLKPVLFRDEVEHIYAAGGSVFIEFGPRNVLTNLVKDILGERPHVAIAVNGSRQKSSDRQLREAVVQLQVLGMSLHAIDPYVLEEDLTPKKKGMNVRLSAPTYVSEKTREAYQQALASGGHVEIVPTSIIAVQADEAAVAAVVTPEQPAVIVPEVAVASPASPPPTPLPIFETPSQEQPADMNSRLHALEQGLSHFREHQREIQRVHEQYAQGQSEYFRIFLELTQQQQTLLASGQLQPQTAEALAQSMMRFHDYQAETLHMHERYMQGQTDIGQALLNIIREQYTALAGAPAVFSKPIEAPTPPKASVNGNHRLETPAYTAPVVEKAPPVAVPEQVAPVISAPAPIVAAPPPAVAAPTPKQNGAMVKEAAPAAESVATPVTMPSIATNGYHATPTPATVEGGAEIAALSEAMLRIVGDKTGYPVEMLELSMDMEADLGIDSIKRVEILGAMREEFPNLPQFSPEALAELRTLQQIVDYMQARSGDVSASTPTPVSAPAAAVMAAPSPVATNGAAPAVEQVAVSPAATPLASTNGTHAAPTTDANIAALSEAMLRIVGDKTGYPVEMLELSMDMEADLGIDSIKRVEILGAMREEFPNLPQFSPEALAELRTLQQIVDYMQEASLQAAPF